MESGRFFYRGATLINKYKIKALEDGYIITAMIG